MYDSFKGKNNDKKSTMQNSVIIYYIFSGINDVTPIFNLKKKFSMTLTFKEVDCYATTAVFLQIQFDFFGQRVEKMEKKKKSGRKIVDGSILTFVFTHEDVMQHSFQNLPCVRAFSISTMHCKIKTVRDLSVQD
jgi:hypothetical protein